MCSRDVMEARQRSSTDRSPTTGDTTAEKAPSWTPLVVLLVFLAFDGIASSILLTPWVPGLQREEDATVKYSLYGTLWDLAILAALRLVCSLYALFRSYRQYDVPPETPFDPYHRNGDKKSREELEEEALEEPCLPWLSRYVSRFAFPCEVVSVVTGIFLVVKCFARLNVEIGVFDDAQPRHPLFWVALCMVAVACSVEGFSVEPVGRIAANLGRHRRKQQRREGGLRRNASMASRFSSSSLQNPLLSSSNVGGDEENEDADVETPMDASASDGDNPAEGGDRGLSDISGDAAYKAGWTDLLGVCAPDTHLILLAFVFLLCAATAQIYVPRYTGKVLDAVAEAYDSGKHKSNGDVWKIPGFVSNIEKLILASILGGVFSGLRGSIFTVVGGRVNVRLRVLLMDSLLCQDIGFFDTTKTGHITSRLTSDTTLVGDQVTLNVNVFLRSVVQAVGVLIFMFMISWQLSLLAFISVPAITILSKWYGHFIRSLTKLMQKKLADGNSVSEAALGSMSTVRAFGAERSELNEFNIHCEKYLALNVRSAVAYCGYATIVTSLPQLVIAVVLFYGGLLVHSDGDDHISSGQLVTFLLYLSSLSDAFNSIGSIFASLTQAVGAADKVFELMHRKPKIERPLPNHSPPIIPEEHIVPTDKGNLARYGINPKKINAHRMGGLHPQGCIGAVGLNAVDMFYPARPERKILNDLTLKAPPGHVIALVGASGGGKSSIVSLVQHLYEPSRGEVSIDGEKVQDLSYEWLSRNISIVSQEPTLFARSIHRNIIYGLEGTDFEPSMAEVEEAARLANAASFIEALPLGYETDVGERGVQMSGGQKQRIAIARALVRKPRVLLLDEATSALDAESEASVQEAIDGMLMRDRDSHDADALPSMTVMIIAHRLSTVRNADIIYVIEAGKVVESGSHVELSQDENGAYSNLIRKQVQAQSKLDT